MEERVGGGGADLEFWIGEGLGQRGDGRLSLFAEASEGGGGRGADEWARVAKCVGEGGDG